MRKRYSILLIILLIVSICTITVNAANLSFTTTMTPSSTNVSEATEVVVTVAVSNLNVGDSGINAFSAYLSYDDEVFETLTDSSVEGLNSWSVTYSTSSGQIALLKNSFVDDDEEIMQITLKTKEGIDEGTSGTISLTNIEVSNSEEEISGDNVSTTITVGTSTSLSNVVSNSTNSTSNNTSNSIKINTTNTSNNTSNNTTNNATNNTSNNTENNTSNTNSSYNNTSSTNNSTTNSDSDDDIPYTGTTSEALIKIILGIIIVALLIYIKMKKMDEDIR